VSRPNHKSPAPRIVSETIYLELSQPLADWLLSLACDDLQRGMNGARFGLTQEDATAFALFLKHNLPTSDAEVPAVRQALRAS